MNTTAHRLVNILLALAIVAVYAAMQQVDGMPDGRAEMAQSAATQDAIKTEAARARYMRAAAQSCGNADWVEVDSHTVRCIPRKAPANTGAVVALAEVAR